MRNQIALGGSNAVDTGLVSAVRQFLALGLSEPFQRSCVRIGGFETLSGGLKAEMVGGLTIHVHAVMKVGDGELLKHDTLMRGVNLAQGRVFPEILHTQMLDDGRYLLVMEECRKHVSLLQKVFWESCAKAELVRLADKVFALLQKVQSIKEGDISGISSTRDPFGARIRTKLMEILQSDSDLAILTTKPGVIAGVVVPPLDDLLGAIDDLLETAAGLVEPRLVHGDPHLANVMVRRSGKTGYRMRLIDPNPEIGFSQPIYDLGKLLHWSEPVGWAKVRPAACSCGHGVTKAGWSLDPRIVGISAAAERRRTWVDRAIRGQATIFKGDYGDLLEPMIALSISSAHLGMAAILSRDPRQKDLSRFVLAHALRNLAAAANGQPSCRQQPMRRRTSLRTRHPAIVGGPIPQITGEHDILGGMLDDARD